MKGILAVAVLLASLVAACGSDTSTDPVASAGADTTSSAASDTSDPALSNSRDSSAFFQPKVRDEGDDGPFWGTTFVVEVPDGQWEARSFDGSEYCLPTNEGDYRVVNDAGTAIALFKVRNPSTITFNRSDSEITASGTCVVTAAVFGDYHDLGSSYTVTNGAVAATFSPEEFFSGQFDGVDVRKPLVPAAGG